MTFDYFVVDNLFKNPLAIAKLVDDVAFFSKEEECLQGITLEKDLTNIPPYAWRGYRSDLLEKTLPELNQSIIRSHDYLFKKFYNIQLDFFNFKSYFHFTNFSLKFSEDFWHRDYSSYASVIYLSPNPPPNSGTLLKHNKKEIVVENKFNRLVCYRGDILHTPQSFFGVTKEDSRLTITSFF